MTPPPETLFAGSPEIRFSGIWEGHPLGPRRVEILWAAGELSGDPALVEWLGAMERGGAEVEIPDLVGGRLDLSDPWLVWAALRELLSEPEREGELPELPEVPAGSE